MNTTLQHAQDILTLLALGLGSFTLTVLGWALRRLLLTYAQRLQAVFLAADAALAPFGRTWTGQQLHAAIAHLRPHVDDPTDPLVLKLLDLLHATLPASEEALSAQDLSAAAAAVTAALEMLLDGVADADFPAAPPAP